MDLKFFEKKLKEREKNIERILKSIAEKDKEIPENWRAKIPYFGDDISLESEADKIEEYDLRILEEHFLELKLKEIKDALKKIKKGDYGICEKCKGKIEIERLKILPETKFCSKCK